MIHNDELTPDGFRKLNRDAILIAASYDVDEERRFVKNALEKALKEQGEDESIRIETWASAVPKAGADQRRSLQRNFYRPSDPHLLGVIYLVGERMGIPLEADFKASTVHEIEKWISQSRSARYRLEPQWPDNPAERRSLLTAGAFPLTGGIFEYLDARGAGKLVKLIVMSGRKVTA